MNMHPIDKASCLLVALLVVACQPADQATRLPPPPSPVKAAPQVAAPPASASAPTAQDEKILDDAETCAHLAGEFGGDQSERDKDVNEQQDGLQCDRAVSQLKDLRSRLPKGSPLHARVNDALATLE